MHKLEQIRSEMKKLGGDAFFISRLADITWLTGFTGTTAYIVVTKDKSIFITDGRYETACRDLLPPTWELEIVKSYSATFDNIATSYKKLIIQPDAATSLTEQMRKSSSVIIDINDTLRHLRMIKTAAELLEIQQEYELAAKSFLTSLNHWQYGQSEIMWAAELEYNMKIHGASGPSFETIVASGERGALPHGTASTKIIDSTDAITIDFGSKRNYTSDYTRVIYNGKNCDILNIIEVVRVAIEKVIAAVKPGVKCAELDNIARTYIADKGYGKYFVHGLGHGVGTEVHELPNINPTSTHTLQSGMVFTIEPGIYIPGKYGVRLEETVAVNESSCLILSSMLDRYVYSIG